MPLVRQVGWYVISLIVEVVRAMFSAFSNKATALSSRADVYGSDEHGGRVVYKNSACLSRLVKGLVIVFARRLTRE
jgi:nitrate reductase NapAB chaperone NapD